MISCGERPLHKCKSLSSSSPSSSSSLSSSSLTSVGGTSESEVLRPWFPFLEAGAGQCTPQRLSFLLATALQSWASLMWTTVVLNWYRMDSVLLSSFWPMVALSDAF